jgi:hypothetical protein
MGARRASCVDDSDFSFRSRRAEGLRALPFIAIGAVTVSRYVPRIEANVARWL